MHEIFTKDNRLYKVESMNRTRMSVTLSYEEDGIKKKKVVAFAHLPKAIKKLLNPK